MSTSVFLLWTLLIINIHSNNITIDTQLGSITGVIQNDYVIFKGIEYTEFPPNGDNRFREAFVKTTPYPNTPYDATQFKPVCLQNDAGTEIMNEDCLFLNIWTPNININNGSIIDDLLPVLFWIHGGSFTTGSGSSSLFHGKTFMKNKDVIYISINYRLGNLGFLSLESILEENGRTTGGMNGINDMIVALQWVQNNIIDYGGDSNKVTTFGESAGGTAICMLLATEYASGLFEKAIIQSGACIGPYAPFQHLSYEIGLEMAHNALTNANFSINDLETLRGLDAVTLVNLPVFQSPNSIFPYTVGPTVPAVDNYILSHTVRDIYITNLTQLNTDEIMVGFTSMDSLIGFPFFASINNELRPTNDEKLRQYFQAYIDNEEYIDMIQDIYYPITDFPSYLFLDQLIINQTMLWYSMNADVCFICPAMQMIQLLEDQGNNVYLYNFRGPSYPYYIPHAGELPFLFNKSDRAISRFGTSWSYQLSYFMTESWTNYAIYGIPNSTIYPDGWIPFVMNGTAINIQDNNGVFQLYYFDNYRNGVCDFWLNQIGENISSNLCLETVPIINADEQEDGLQILQFVLIAAGSTIVIIVVAVLLWKYVISNKSEGDYSVYSTIERNEMPKYGAT